MLLDVVLRGIQFGTFSQLQNANVLFCTFTNAGVTVGLVGTKISCLLSKLMKAKKKEQKSVFLQP